MAKKKTTAKKGTTAKKKSARRSAKPYPLPFTTRKIPWDQRKGAEVWPNGARMAAVLYTAPEQWRWDRNESFVTPGVFRTDDEKRPSLSSRSAVGYGFEIGMYRIRDILKEHDYKLSLWTTGNSAEQYPEIIREFSELGHEVNAHGYSEGSPISNMTREEQRKDIKKTLKVLTDVTGKRPRAWIGPGAMCNVDTVELLAEEGILCHADLQDDELPYFIDVKGKTLVEVPFRMVGAINDYWLAQWHYRSTKEILSYVLEAFDAYYREASVRPLLFNYGTHPFVSGRADTGWVLSEVLRHIKQHKDVWIATYCEIADWWMDRFGKGYKF